MQEVAIVADSGCDLPPAVAERYGILQAPLVARFGEYELRDTPETRAEFWQRYNISVPPHSSGPSVGEWAEIFSQALQRGREVIAVTLTSKHSGTYNSALLAAREFGNKVHVFDSWSLSLGEGLLVRKAAEMAAAGAGVPEILATLHDWRQRLRIVIYLDTTEALQRGGRLAALMGIIKRISAALSIRPLLNMNEGVLGLKGVVRTLKKGIRQSISEIQGQSLRAIAVAHTRAPDVARTLAEQAADVWGKTVDEVLVAEAGPALAVHAGPGAFGLAYIIDTPAS